MRDVLRILEAAYPTDDDETSWLANLSSAVRTHAGIPNDGVFAQTYDASVIDACKFGAVGSDGVSDRIIHDMYGARVRPYWQENPDLVREAFLSISFSLYGELPTADRHPYLRELMDEFGIGEVLGINASLPSGHGVIVCILVRRTLKLSDATHRLFARVASHLATANRLRLRVAALDEVGRADAADAIIDSEGRVVHAARGGRVRDARERLADAAGTLLRARGRRHADHGERASAAWKALVDARWSLVDHFEHDGRRFLLAQRNDPQAPPLELLTVRERQVVALAAIGRANKEIAYELGIATSTVGVLLARASSRLGVRSRRDLVAAFFDRTRRAEAS
jgi:DNA-binding CsgD family transcriptional regulator